jgi:hypothetical protein
MSHHPKRTRISTEKPPTLHVEPIGASLPAASRSSHRHEPRANVIDMSSGPMFTTSSSKSLPHATTETAASTVTVAETAVLILKFLMNQGFQHTARLFRQEARSILEKVIAFNLDHVKSLSSVLEEYVDLKEKDLYRQRFLQRFDNDENVVLALSGMYDLIEAAHQRLSQQDRTLSSMIWEK